MSAVGDARDTPLPSWNEGATKQAITEFVTRVTAEGSADYVPPEARVAVFDNDGTLWCEKPMYIQLDFVLRRMAAMAEEDASLREYQPWKAVYEKDYGWLTGVVTKHYQGDDSDLRVLGGGVLKAHEGITIEAFEAAAEAFLVQERHPTLGRSYLECGYQPMIELLRYLEANGFANYIVSGGGRDFMRPISQQMYGVPRERVIGSTVSLAYKDDDDGGHVIRQAQLDILDDGPVKPARIWSRIGRRPILAAGNSNGDIEMLRFASGRSRPALRLLLLHDDAEREFAYVTGAERALSLAKAQGWTVASIQNDWKRVFAPINL
jgi:phosphoglycolate phosphatase-like HAD superfamily hydrolase